MSRLAVIGGGIVGVAVAREMLRRHPETEVTLFEKEDRLASHQTGRNSGVVHAGLYYQPGRRRRCCVAAAWVCSNSTAPNGTSAGSRAARYWSPSPTTNDPGSPTSSRRR